MEYTRRTTRFTDLHDDCVREIFGNFNTKDKFKYERVQKVWQALIHESTQVLDDAECPELMDMSIFDTTEQKFIKQTPEELLKRWQNYWLKCPNVTTINIS